MAKTVMRASGLTGVHRIVEWERPGEDISLQEAIDTGRQLNYIEARPGTWVRARCACGEVREGAVAEVFAWAKGHDETQH